ncbi:MAG TPA: hypothetical protein DGU45_06590 [Planctomycetes bacterium]|nr:hypothetical protein [Planctomycetota bacterium]
MALSSVARNSTSFTIDDVRISCQKMSAGVNPGFLVARNMLRSYKPSKHSTGQHPKSSAKNRS